MTALLAPRAGRTATRRPALTALPKRNEQMATIPFLLVVAGVLALAMVGMLLLVTNLQDQAFLVQSKQQEAQVLSNKASLLQTEVADARSISSLADRAQRLGMHADTRAVPIRLSDGKVLGNARAARGSDLPKTAYSANTPRKPGAQSGGGQ